MKYIIRKIKEFVLLKKILIGVASLFLIIGGYFLFFGGTTEKKEIKPAGQVQRIVKAVRGDLDLSVSSDGVVQPINKVEIRSKAGGKIVQLNFIEGRYVQEGDLLILVDQTITKNNLEQAKADLETAKAVLVQAQNNNKRTLELYEKNLVSQQEVDQSNTELVRAQAQLVKAKAALSNAEDQMNDTRIVAPVSGIILSKNVELGQIISSAMSNVGGGTLLASVADMEHIYIYAKVDEVDIGRVKMGQKAKVIADAFPDDEFEGRVERIAPQGVTQQNVTTFDVIILVKNEGLKLKAGMSTSVEIEVYHKVNVLLLPNEGLKDPKSEQGKILMEAANLKLPEEPKDKSSKTNVKIDSNNPFNNETDPQKLRERFQNMTQEERDKYRQQMRERFEKMSPEEREKAREGRRQMFQQGGTQGGGTFMLFGGASTSSRQAGKRVSQISNESEERWRIVVVKDSNVFRPKLVKAGASNFDNTEIIEGLKEGDEVQITTISRAKIASDQFTERLRSTSVLGGGSTRGIGR